MTRARETFWIHWWVGIKTWNKLYSICIIHGRPRHSTMLSVVIWLPTSERCSCLTTCWDNQSTLHAQVTTTCPLPAALNFDWGKTSSCNWLFISYFSACWSHGYKLFCRWRMDAHHPIQLLLLHTHLDSDGKALRQVKIWCWHKHTFSRRKTTAQPAQSGCFQRQQNGPQTMQD